MQISRRQALLGAASTAALATGVKAAPAYIFSSVPNLRLSVANFGCVPGATGIQMRDGARACALALYNAGGGTMYIPAGLYTGWDMGRPVVVGPHNVAVVGDPDGTIIVPDLTTIVDGTSFPFPQAYGSVFVVGNPSVTVGGASYAGTRAGTTTGGGNNAVDLGYVDSTTTASNISFYGLTIDATLTGSGGSGLVYTGPVLTGKMNGFGIFVTFCHNCLILGCTVRGMPSTGIAVGYGRDNKIIDNTVELCGFWAPLGSDCNGISAGGWMDNRVIANSSDGLIISHNRIRGCHDEGIQNAIWQNTIISNNVIVGCGDKGIEGNSPLATTLNAANGGTKPAWVIAAAVAAGGSGGTNGTRIVTGTTGTGTLPTFLVTVSGGAITAVIEIITAGNYWTLPTVPSAEPVTGAGLTGATLNLTLLGQKIPGDRIIQGNMIDGTIPPDVPFLPYVGTFGIMGIGLADGNENEWLIADNQIANVGGSLVSGSYPATVTAATIIAGGSGGTNGTQTVTGTTGAGTLFQASVTVSGGAITAVLSISNAGSYIQPPANITNEPVTGAGLVGATLNLTLSYGSAPSNGFAILAQQGGHCHTIVARNKMVNIGSAAGGTAIFLSVQRMDILDNELTSSFVVFASMNSASLDEVHITGNRAYAPYRFVNGVVGESGIGGTTWDIEISRNTVFGCAVSPIIWTWYSASSLVVSAFRIENNHFEQANYNSTFYQSYIALGGTADSTHVPTINELIVRGNYMTSPSGHPVVFPIGKAFTSPWYDLAASSILSAIVRDNIFTNATYSSGEPTLFDAGMTAAIVYLDQSNEGIPGYNPIRGSFVGTLPASGPIWVWVADRAITIPASHTGALANSYVEPIHSQTATSTHAFPFTQNGTSVGTFNVTAASGTFTFTFSAPVTIVPGDVITVNSDGTDATLNAFGWVVGGE